MSDGRWKWEVYEEGRHAGWYEAIIVHAQDGHEAAEEYAARRDEAGDYDVVSGRASPTVHVRRKGTDGEAIYIVEGESVPQYNARFKESR